MVCRVLSHSCVDLGRTQADHVEMSMLRLSDRSRHRPPSTPVGFQHHMRTANRRGSEMPPEVLLVPVPELFAKDSAAHGAPKEPPHDQAHRIVEPYQGRRPGPYDVPGDAVVPICDPLVAPQRRPQLLSEQIVRRLWSSWARSGRRQTLCEALPGWRIPVWPPSSCPHPKCRLRPIACPQPDEV